MNRGKKCCYYFFVYWKDTVKIYDSCTQQADLKILWMLCREKEVVKNSDLK